MINENGQMSNIIKSGALALGIKLPSESYALFEKYHDFLDKRRQAFNLTAITGIENVARMHFLDSIALLTTANFHDAQVLDIGSGAGFPGIPLKIAEPSIVLTLLDSTLKKVVFVSELCSALDLKATCIHGRAEEMAYKCDLREKFDIAVSRAVARLNIICELSLPYVRVGGVFIAMKSIESSTEIDDAKETITALGASLKESIDYKIPGTEILHRAIIIQKISRTQSIYPRRFSKIKKDII